MTPEEIIDMFDQNPDLPLATMARMTGWSVKELKTLLMERCGMADQRNVIACCTLEEMAQMMALLVAQGLAFEAHTPSRTITLTGGY